MKKYVCTICGYIYDEAKEKIKFVDLPDDWTCPLCGAPKAAFEEIKEEKEEEKKEEVKEVQPKEDIVVDDDMRKLSDGELSAIFSNLSRASEKQFLARESELFNDLADYYKNKVTLGKEKDIKEFTNLLNKDLEDFSVAMNDAKGKDNRGVLRCLTWSEKVTRILSAIVQKYEQKGIDIIKNTNIYVCDICGFIYIGDDVPPVCPVCKVPSLKIIKMERE